MFQTCFHAYDTKLARVKFCLFYQHCPRRKMELPKVISMKMQVFSAVFQRLFSDLRLSLESIIFTDTLSYLEPSLRCVRD